MHLSLPSTFQYHNGIFFFFKQYRAYYGAFKTVHEKDGNTEESSIYKDYKGLLDKNRKDSLPKNEFLYSDSALDSSL